MRNKKTVGTTGPIVLEFESGFWGGINSRRPTAGEILSYLLAPGRGDAALVVYRALSEIRFITEWQEDAPEQFCADENGEMIACVGPHDGSFSAAVEGEVIGKFPTLAAAKTACDGILFESGYVLLGRDREIELEGN